MTDGKSMTITANGSDYDVPTGTSLADFVKDRGLALDRVVVERNGHPLTPREARETTLEPADRLEIIQIVAGG